MTLSGNGLESPGRCLGADAEHEPEQQKPTETQSCSTLSTSGSEALSPWGALQFLMWLPAQDHCWDLPLICCAQALPSFFLPRFRPFHWNLSKWLITLKQGTNGLAGQSDLLPASAHLCTQWWVQCHQHMMVGICCAVTGRTVPVVCPGCS